MAETINIGKLDIAKILFDRAQKAVDRVLEGALAEYGKKLIVDADANREFLQFTGNTVASYAVGIYTDGVPKDMILNENGTVVHSKVKKGETVKLSNPVEGEARELEGAVDITTEYGEELSANELASERPIGGTGLVMVTGTEYSEYLENTHKLDVLTNTYLQAKNEAIGFLQAQINKEK